MTKVKALRSFNATPQGGLVEIGDVLDVPEVRAGELVLLGLAALVKVEKAAPVLLNKMAPQPENKETIRSGEPAMPPRRPRRSARKAK